MKRSSRPSRIVVTIDRLVLRGVEPGESRALAGALESSLRQALSERGLPVAASAQLPSVPRARLASAGDGAALGRAAGQAIHGSVQQGLTGRRV